MSDKNCNGGISFLGMLTILFIALKITGYIDWSWILVLLPILIPFGAVLCVIVSAFFAILLKSLMDKYEG